MDTEGKSKVSAGGIAWLVLVGLLVAASQSLPLAGALWSGQAEIPARVTETGDESNVGDSPAESGNLSAWEQATTWMGVDSTSG